MSPEELTLAATAAAISLSKNLSTDEINLLCAFLQQFSTTLATIAIQRDDDDESADIEAIF